MKVYTVLEAELHEGGTIVKVFDIRQKAEDYVKNNPLVSRIDYYEIKEWEVE